jgi:hypothetical protein
VVGAGATGQSGEHDIADGSFQQPLRASHSIVQPGAFLEFDFIKRLSFEKLLRCFTASTAHKVHVKGQSGGASNRYYGILPV